MIVAILYASSMNNKLYDYPEVLWALLLYTYLKRWQVT